MICAFCGSVRKNENSLRNHERLCKVNPLRQKSSFEQYNSSRSGPWNKGKSKYNDPRVKANGDSVSIVMKGRVPNFIWTDELRNQQSVRKKKLYEEFPEKHPNRLLANNRKSMSYPERIAYDWFLKECIEFDHNPKIGKYFPDFVIGNTIVEIDGEYWHDAEADAKRDLELKSLGYTILRIKAKDHIEDILTKYFRV